jgi:hypothetical protein
MTRSAPIAATPACKISERHISIRDTIVSPATRALEFTSESLPTYDAASIRIMAKKLKAMCRKELSRDSLQKEQESMPKSSNGFVHEKPVTMLVAAMGSALRHQKRFTSDSNAVVEAANRAVKLTKNNSKNNLLEDDIIDAANLLLMDLDTSINAERAYVYRRLSSEEQPSALLWWQYETAWNTLLKIRMKIAESLRSTLQSSATDTTVKAEPVNTSKLTDAEKRARESTDPEVLSKLSKHRNPRVRAEAIMNEYTSQTSVCKCVNDADRTVQKLAIEYLDESTKSKEMLIKVSNGPDNELVVIAASNLAMPLHQLESLIHHQSEEVCVAAEATIEKKKYIKQIRN